MITLETPVKELPYLGKRLNPKLKKLGVQTVRDLLWYLPSRYDDLSEIKKISDLQEEEKATIRGTVMLLKSRRSWKRKMMVTEILLEDDSGQLQAVWFRQAFVAKALKTGDEIYLSGQVKKDLHNWKMINPVYEKVREEQLHTARLTPLYHLTEGLSHKQLRFLMKEALEASGELSESLPNEIIASEKLLDIQSALQQIHFPSSWDELHRAEKRLKFEELLWLQLRVMIAKRDYQQSSAPSLVIPPDQLQTVMADLPFGLTNDQQKALAEIVHDLEQPLAMNRLLQGDVGSGKTVVAALATYICQSSGYQVAFMAATEILAQQHFRTLQQWFPEISLALLTGKQKMLAEGGSSGDVTRPTLLKHIASGNIKIVVGTHSLIHEAVKWQQLGLAVIDEQHRFGVQQRQKLREQNADGQVPHLLSLTATPIPRTLQLTLYGDLSISIIKEKPGQRKEIITKVVAETNRAKAYDWILGRLRLGEQLFVVCPQVQDNEQMNIKSVLTEYRLLSEEIYPGLDIRFLHGKMKLEEKKAVIDDFRAGLFPILVASSVIEVGIDIPGATMMIIEGAERFGLAQLHQFRGRIGRNDKQAFCFLFATSDDQLNLTRLKALTETNDGFKLAEVDLELRGAGDVFGTKQSGLIELKAAQITDTELIKKAQDWANKLISEQQYLENDELQTRIKKLPTTIHLE